MTTRKIKTKESFIKELSALLKKYDACINATAGNDYMSMWISTNKGHISIGKDHTVHKSHVKGLSSKVLMEMIPTVKETT